MIRLEQEPLRTHTTFRIGGPAAYYFIPEREEEIIEALDFANRDVVFDACKAKAEELGKKNGWLLYPLGIALSGKQRTPGGGTDLACMMGREKTLQRVQAAIAKLNG